MDGGYGRRVLLAISQPRVTVPLASANVHLTLANSSETDSVAASPEPDCWLDERKTFSRA
jgi:hypothetical protein